MLLSGVFSITTNDTRDKYAKDNPGESSAGDVELIEVPGLWMTSYANGFLLKLPGRRFNQIFFKTREQADDLVKVYDSNSHDNLHRGVTTANQLALQL